MAIVRNRGKNARNISQKIWLNSAEAEQVKAAAGDVPVATWLRNLALGQPAQFAPPRTARRTKSRRPEYAAAVQPVALAVSRVGNNLNQIARAVNSDVRARRPIDAIAVAIQLMRIRQEIGEDLRAVSRHFLQEVPDAGEDL